MTSPKRWIPALVKILYQTRPPKRTSELWYSAIIIFCIALCYVIELAVEHEPDQISALIYRACLYATFFFVGVVCAVDDASNESAVNLYKSFIAPVEIKDSCIPVAA